MSRTSRRQFAKTVAALPLAALAQTPPPAPEEKPFAKAQTEVAKAQHGAHLDDADLARIGASLREQATLIERLRAFSLKNSDEPDFTFSVLTKRW